MPLPALLATPLHAPRWCRGVCGVLAAAALVAGCSTTSAPAVSPVQTVDAPPTATTPASAPATVPPVASASASPDPSPTSSPAPTAKPAPSKATPLAGRIEVESQGFAVTLPKTWAALDVDGHSNDKAVQALIAKSLGVKLTPAQIGQAIGVMRAMMPNAVRFVAVKPATFDVANQFVSTTIVAKIPSGGATLSQLEAGTAINLSGQSDVISHLRHHQVKLANGTAAWLSYDQRAASATGPRTAHVTMYLLVHGDGAYLLMLMTQKTPTTAGAKEFATFAGSLKFLANAGATG